MRSRRVNRWRRSDKDTRYRRPFFSHHTIVQNQKNCKKELTNSPFIRYNSIRMFRWNTVLTRCGSVHRTGC